ncbi:Dynamin-like GTPase that mediates homotypic ER fusion [Salvia divinorum]|uniref:Dynamin-like GTPase that mediates homotypic ER fusion n=1 Tax=Salvia divinorum TaxID=28513 RepID=A0ABD1HQX7_SALDI
MATLFGDIRRPRENAQPTQLIDGNGDLNESGFDNFIHGVAASDLHVVAIVGSQSSGKSTLLNHLFGTDFSVMDARKGRHKTTEGIWIAKAPYMEPLTVVIDVEGLDGKERGQADISFEKQSALFAVAVAHTVIINMWYTEIGREHAANRPLLLTVFEAMLSLSLFSQKTTLIFVVRDKTDQTPFETLESDLKKDVEKIWEAVPKPPGHEETPLTKIFNVKVTALSHYVYMRQEFDKEVAQLKLQLISYAKDNIDLPTSKICLSNAKTIWDVIKKDKGLKLPVLTSKVMIATIRCQEIAEDELRLFDSDQTWSELQQEATTQLVECFGAKASSILAKYLSKYDNESKYLVQNVTEEQEVFNVISAKRQYLMSEILKLVRPAYKCTLDHLCSEALESFKPQATALKDLGKTICECRVSCGLQFDQQCSDHATIEMARWVDDASTMRIEFLDHVTIEKTRLEDDAATVRQELLVEINELALGFIQEGLSVALTSKLPNVLRESSVDEIWPSIRKESSTVKKLMNDRFCNAMNPMKHEMAKEDAYLHDPTKHEMAKEDDEVAYLHDPMKYELAKKEAYLQCLDMLSTMAVIRLDEEYDVVRRVLHSELMDSNSGGGISTNYLSSSTWEEVPHEMTSITPIRCREIWVEFKGFTVKALAEIEKTLQGLKSVHTSEHWSVLQWALIILAIAGAVALAAYLISNPAVLFALKSILPLVTESSAMEAPLLNELTDMVSSAAPVI